MSAQTMPTGTGRKTRTKRYKECAQPSNAPVLKAHRRELVETF
ncbi:MAG: hypothetical protein ACJA1R_002133, partial [Flavobacteriales bacterium]